MLVDFFLHLRERRVPVTMTEYLALLEALSAGLANCSLDDFYSLARICLVKNEAHYDRFDVAFAEYFDRIRLSETDGRVNEWISQASEAAVNPDELLLLEQQLHEDNLPPESDTDEADQAEEDQWKMMGSAGNSPGKGKSGMNAESLRLESGSGNAVKTVRAWDSRQFQALDDDVELGTRNIKMALRRLRKFAREGMPDELDLDETIRSTAKNAGWLDLKMRPEKRNKVKVLLLMDVGGSMAGHVKTCEELFSAARAEFKHLEYFYFHNCVYDTVWKSEGPSFQTHYPISYLINRFGRDYKLIFVGDAAMGPTEITDLTGSYMGSHAGGGSSHTGEKWLRTLLEHYRQAVWLNPEQQRFWELTQSTVIIRELMENRMFPLTLSGLDQAMRQLNK